ncbi:hypothetical protein DGG96_00155 [Legionella qingyii]|uniref:Uncharacterized protein n=1 Tax=Legionella qingyii TaxID=2184757 RepID=A0A317U7S5_9GAMM|nr:hypothetical protein [Legionella qingyii]PWY57549.1 hypothetical protein DGG96_00155 [Legionella qingyii]RUR25984.1 hypothetical protein ELY20_02235 [Legionella qingyii]
MLCLKLARHIARQYQKKGTIHLPDFVIYDFDEEEYQTFWREITSYPRQRLYTDGIDVFQVSWFRTIFESFKGWLGFENHCHPNRIEMTLAKVAYTGYIKGFKSKELNKSTDGFPISSRFIKLTNLSRTNETSGELQRLLMGYFITHSHAFPEFNASIRESYPFGQTLIQEHLAYLIPSIDPQDKQTIKNAINQIRCYRQSVSKTYCFHSSPFAEAYAQFLVEQQQYHEALQWFPEVKSKFKESFIDYYLTQKKLDPQALKVAIELIAALFLSANMNDQEKAVDYIKVNFDDEEQAVYLTPYSKLRAQVAKAYLEDAKREHNKWAITKLLTGNQTIKYLAQAVRLQPQIMEEDDSTQDIILKEEWTLYQFDRAMESNRFHDADALYTDNPGFKFNKYGLERLREYYFTQFNANESRIKRLLLSQNPEAAVQIAEEQVTRAKKIVGIEPHDSLVMEATVNYASTLLAVDELIHSAKDSDRTQLNKAQLYLSKYLFLNSNSALTQVYNKLLLRKIDCLIARLAVPIDYNDHLNTRIDFIKEHIGEIEELKKELRAFIAFNESKTNEMRQTLAKMYYLLADALVYFEEKKQESMPYFKKAKELMPENIYYNLRYLEIIQDERRYEAREKLSEIGHLHQLQYNNYMLERWGEDKIMSSGFDIHMVPPNDSLFNSIGRAIGFSKIALYPR